MEATNGVKFAHKKRRRIGHLTCIEDVVPRKELVKILDVTLIPNLFKIVHFFRRQSLLAFQYRFEIRRGGTRGLSDHSFDGG